MNAVVREATRAAKMVCNRYHWLEEEDVRNELVLHLLEHKTAPHALGWEARKMAWVYARRQSCLASVPVRPRNSEGDVWFLGRTGRNTDFLRRIGHVSTNSGLPSSRKRFKQDVVSRADSPRFEEREDIRRAAYLAGLVIRKYSTETYPEEAIREALLGGRSCKSVADRHGLNRDSFRMKLTTVRQAIRNHPRIRELVTQ